MTVQQLINQLANIDNKTLLVVEGTFLHDIHSCNPITAYYDQSSKERFWYQEKNRIPEEVIVLTHY